LIDDLVVVSRFYTIITKNAQAIMGPLKTSTTRNNRWGARGAALLAAAAAAAAAAERRGGGGKRMAITTIYNYYWWSSMIVFGWKLLKKVVENCSFGVFVLNKN
jgi:hypothetical protein